MSKRAVVVYSGGLDSTVLLYKAIDMGYSVLPIGFNYGQKHSKELFCAKDICRSLGLNYKMVNLSHLLKSALTDPNQKIPDGHYEDENMKKTVVPNRNAIMISIAYGYAISKGAEVVFYGAHAGDHSIYPDCRPEFFEALKIALKLGNYSPPRLEAPFIEMRKEKIVELGDCLKVPLYKTWSCYKGRKEHCGTCGTCIERKEAFELARVQDPTIYSKGGFK